MILFVTANSTLSIGRLYYFVGSIKDRGKKLFVKDSLFLKERHPWTYNGVISTGTENERMTVAYVK